MKAEKERNGLVIERAVYYIRGEREAMNDQNSLDVTVPIQFWVNDSTLHLFNVSKRSSMLGFFDLIKFSSSAAAAASENSEMSNEMPKPHATVPSWTDWMCSFLFDRSDRSSMDSRVRVDEAATAELSVTYSYAGITYEIAIGDGEEIILPNPRASRLPK